MPFVRGCHSSLVTRHLSLPSVLLVNYNYQKNAFLVVCKEGLCVFFENDLFIQIITSIFARLKETELSPLAYGQSGLKAEAQRCKGDLGY